MTNTARRYAATTALFGALAFTAAICAFAQIKTEAAPATRVSQYCIPQEPTFDAHRFYCRNERTPISMPEEVSVS